ncbi:MAG: TIGR04076 family protein [Oscillospiraceae bacterium]|jgi:uncharacterized repeat protein (TIGR04076 family)|nr:TIGR04076 family protein [Oscillospiraceae bacterium]
MKKWVVEDWEFELTATDGKAGHCRLGLEKGDKFVFQYECPAGICPKLMAKQLYTLCEVIRFGGDFTYSASKEKYELDLPCPDGCIQFHLKAYPINRDGNGTPKPNNARPED